MSELIEIKDYFPSGIIRRQYFVDKNNDKQGLVVENYSTGDIFSETHFVNNKQHGKTIIYNKDGSTKTSGEYRNGKKHGRWISKNREYYIEGRKCEEEEFKLYIIKQRLTKKRNGEKKNA